MSSPDRRRGLAAALLTLVLVAAGCGSSSGTSPGSGGGSAAVSNAGALPAITVRSLADGTEVALASLATGPLVVNLWAPWCPPCRNEMPDFQKVAAAHPGAVTIVGLATGTEEQAAKDYGAKLGVTYPLYYDIDDAALEALGVAGLPATLFVDAHGTIVGTHAGAMSAADLEAAITKNLGVAPVSGG